jgi:hypothetical protein
MEVSCFFLCGSREGSLYAEEAPITVMEAIFVDSFFFFVERRRRMKK